MKMDEIRTAMIFRAAEALKAVLCEVSTVNLKEIRPAARGKTGLVARVDVLGHSHTLACEVKADADPHHLCDLLRECNKAPLFLPAMRRRCSSRPIFRRRRRALCKESHAAFLDLEGNARLALGEVFIGKRSLRHVQRSIGAH